MDYTKEVKERWGNTQAYKQSRERYDSLSIEDQKKIQDAGDQLLKKILTNMKSSEAPSSVSTQDLISQHYNGLNAFYEPNLEIYRGLGEMYVGDERFKKFFDKYSDGFAEYMREAIKVFCDAHAGEDDIS